ncbi:MAG TPA: hypothetical protein VJ998_01970, partial [Pseudomonadales bacterium]|nr:hypothetical protein [Pseudomonadales bacterium]
YILFLLPHLVTFMGKTRRGNYVFLTWKGDHTPRHVHVYRHGRLVVKWDLEHHLPMKGRAGRRLVAMIQRLDSEGAL